MPKKRGSGGAPLEFDIIGPEGAALQFDGQYGRSPSKQDPLFWRSVQIQIIHQSLARLFANGVALRGRLLGT